MICSLHMLTLFPCSAVADGQAGAISAGSQWRLLHRAQLPGAMLLRRQECIWAQALL